MSAVGEKLDKIISYLELIIKDKELVPDQDTTITDFESSISEYEKFAIEELNLEQITVDNHKSAILGFLNFSKGVINKKTVEAYSDSNESTSWKSNQLKALRKYIREYLKLGKWINKIKLPKEKVQAKKNILPTNDQLAQFCSYLPSFQTQIIFLMMFNSGLRIGEIISLKFSNINFDQNLIDASGVHKGETKFSWFSFFTKQTSEYLDSYTSSDEFQFEEENEDSSRLFTVSARTVQQAFKDISELIGISLNPHLLRTIFAERCREAKIKNEYIDAFCGRTPRGMLEQHYTDYSPEALRKQYDKIELFLTLRFPQEQ